MKGLAFWQLWTKPTVDQDAVKRAVQEAEERDKAIARILPVLFAHRERNHFVQRIALAYREEPR